MPKENLKALLKAAASLNPHMATMSAEVQQRSLAFGMDSAVCGDPGQTHHGHAPPNRQSRRPPTSSASPLPLISVATSNVPLASIRRSIKNYARGLILTHLYKNEEGKFAAEVEIVVARQTALGGHDVGVRIAIDHIIDGGIGVAFWSCTLIILVFCWVCL